MKNRPPQQALLLGCFIILIGALTLINNLNIFDTSSYLQFWPMVFIALGILKIIQANGRSGYFIGLAFLLIGSALTLKHLGLIQFRLHDWWPVFLILAGIAVILRDPKKNHQEPMNQAIFQAKQQTNDTTHHQGVFMQTNPVTSGDQFNNTSNSAAEDRVDILGLMSGNQIKNNSSNFKGGEINVFLSGVELDLRGASLQQDAVLNMFAFWGGIKLTIPTDWTVVNNCNAIMGGIDDRSIPAPGSNKRLIIQGYAIMGGMEIRN